MAIIERLNNNYMNNIIVYKSIYKWCIKRVVYDGFRCACGFWPTFTWVSRLRGVPPRTFFYLTSNKLNLRKILLTLPEIDSRVNKYPGKKKLTIGNSSLHPICRNISYKFFAANIFLSKDLMHIQCTSHYLFVIFSLYESTYGIDIKKTIFKIFVCRFLIISKTSGPI